MSLNYRNISEFFGVEKKLFSRSELESESKKTFVRGLSRVSESKVVTPLITTRDSQNHLFSVPIRWNFFC